ncbi:BEM_HP_G0139930.mRNA.1.CDS.1 [Saccharomyces cerevisiae]|nr:BEM_HP_G0129800.mRNA.1.CDS.1 [Saccharomyces cerevisiae]CAI4943784.1 BEM_HP_G0139930.mRNA.1.CDS.1 [Saccharomyces cerevisiae]CAI6473280.1 BEM_HP_G0129800.mRNA.1.CDS.1 [Saccharomyces cerevisiae]CAI6566986.1 BEM_HP_G0139930.mRNA.1.CDS.1 [Saccharomyces cerevisiae]
MFTFLKIILWLFSLALASAININDITFSNLEITPLTANKQPDQGWAATFDFSIADASSIREGDEFTLSMPHVYRIKLLNSSQTATISLADGTEAFKCYVSQQAAYLYENTTFTCTAQNDLSSYNTIDGSITFSLNFSDGGSSYEYELENAKFFKSGPMLVKLGNQMSDVVNFDPAAFTENVFHSGRSTGYGSFESYHLGMYCPNGYFLGGTEKIDYDSSNNNVDLDCSSVQVYSSNDFNDWWFPQSYNDTNADVTCFGSNLWITLEEKLYDGEMLWVNALQSLPANVNTIDHALEVQYTCLDTIANTTYATQFSTTREFIVYQGRNLGTASAKSSFISTTTTDLTSINTSAYSTGSISTVETGNRTTSEVISHVVTTSTKLSPTATTSLTIAQTSIYSTDSNITVGTDIHTTSEVISDVETISRETASTVVAAPTSTTGWTGAMNTYIPQFTSSSFATINSTPIISSSAVFETSDASIVNVHTENITNTAAVPSEEPTFVNATRNSLNSFCSSKQPSSPSSYTSSPLVSKNIIKKLLRHPSFDPIRHHLPEDITTIDPYSLSQNVIESLNKLEVPKKDAAMVHNMMIENLSDLDYGVATIHSNNLRDLDLKPSLPATKQIIRNNPGRVQSSWELFTQYKASMENVPDELMEVVLEKIIKFDKAEKVDGKKSLTYQDLVRLDNGIPNVLGSVLKYKIPLSFFDKYVSEMTQYQIYELYDFYSLDNIVADPLVLHKCLTVLGENEKIQQTEEEKKLLAKIQKRNIDKKDFELAHKLLRLIGAFKGKVSLFFKLYDEYLLKFKNNEDDLMFEAFLTLCCQGYKSNNEKMLQYAEAFIKEGFDSKLESKIQSVLIVANAKANIDLSLKIYNSNISTAKREKDKYTDLAESDVLTESLILAFLSRDDADFARVIFDGALGEKLISGPTAAKKIKNLLAQYGEALETKTSKQVMQTKIEHYMESI